MATTFSFSDEVPLQKNLSQSLRENRVRDAEKIRQDFISSKMLLIPPKIVRPSSNGLRQDEH
jgi:hypothetical protein